MERMIIAGSRDALKKTVAREGHFLLDMETVSGSGITGLFSMKFGKPFRDRDFLAFNQEFAVLIRSGLPIPGALDAAIENSGRGELTSILKDIRNDITSGQSLSQAFGKYEHLFSRFYVASIEAGEKSGNVPMAMERYIAYLRKVREIKQKVVSVSVYPVILVVISLFALIYLLVFVVPVFTRTFFEAGTQLPLITTMLVNFSNLLRSHALMLLVIVGLIGVGLALFRKSKGGRQYIDKWKLAIPAIGNVYLFYYVSRLARTLSTLLAGGTPLVTSVRIASAIVANVWIRKHLDLVITNVEQGMGFAESLAQTGVFPRLAIRLIDAGEKGGALVSVLEDVAEFYDSEVNTTLSMLTSAIEPALMVIMGLLIGFIVLAMYMPIFQLGSVIG